MTESNDESASLREPGDIAAMDDDAVPAEAQPDDGEQTADAFESLGELRAEVERWRDLAMRSQADLDNYRKRMAREKSDALKYSNSALLESLLPIIDNFYLGLEAARGEESSIIYQGMAMVLKQIEDFLRDQGIEIIETGNAPFDPNLHEAIGQEHSDEVPEGHITRELRRGYRLKDRLLRASNIFVSKGPQA